MGINIADLKAQGLDINSLIEMLKAKANEHGTTQAPNYIGNQTS